ncbi:hypothetical protein QUA13_30125, partial [Microcoleus sp. S28C3]|uniref:hypothetical protein n=1 Tax=Microcoleus sp. S28C3 TaxID=3055414 RepID=UPI002FD2DCCA
KYVNILTHRKSFRIALDIENHLGLLYVGVVPRVPTPAKAGQPRGVCPYKNYTNDLGLLYQSLVISHWLLVIRTNK